jgi:hypothetical protein
MKNSKNSVLKNKAGPSSSGSGRAAVQEELNRAQADEEHKKKLDEEQVARQEQLEKEKEDVSQKRIKELLNEINKLVASQVAKKALLEELKSRNIDEEEIPAKARPIVGEINEAVKSVIEKATTIGAAEYALHKPSKAASSRRGGDAAERSRAEKNAKTDFYQRVIKYQESVLKAAISAKESVASFNILQQEAQNNLNGFHRGFHELMSFNSEISKYRQNANNVQKFCLGKLSEEPDSPAKELLKKISDPNSGFIFKENVSEEEIPFNLDESMTLRGQGEFLNNVKILAEKLSDSLEAELDQVCKNEETRQISLQKLEDEAVKSLVEVKNLADGLKKEGIDVSATIKKATAENVRSNPLNQSPQKISGKTAIPSLFSEIGSQEDFNVAEEFEKQKAEFIAEKRTLVVTSEYALREEFAKEVIRVAGLVSNGLKASKKISQAVIEENTSIFNSALANVSKALVEKKSADELAKLSSQQRQDELRKQIIEKSQVIFTTLKKLQKSPYLVAFEERGKLVLGAPMIAGKDRERLLLPTGGRASGFSEDEMLSWLHKNAENSQEPKEQSVSNKIKEGEDAISVAYLKGREDYLRSLKARCEDVEGALNKKVAELDQKIAADLKRKQDLEKKAKEAKAQAIAELVPEFQKIYAKKVELDDLIGVGKKGEIGESPTKVSKRNNPSHWTILGDERDVNSQSKNLVIRFYKNASTVLKEQETKERHVEELLKGYFLENSEITAEFKKEAKVAEAKLQAAIDLENLRRNFKFLKSDHYFRTTDQIKEIYAAILKERSASKFNPVFDELIGKESLEVFSDQRVEKNLATCLSKAPAALDGKELEQMKLLSSEINFLKAEIVRRVEMQREAAKREAEMRKKSEEVINLTTTTRTNLVGPPLRMIGSDSENQKFYVARIDRVAQQAIKKGDKPYYQPILKQTGSEDEIRDRKYAFRGSLQKDNRLKGAKEIITKGLQETKELFDSNNYKLTNQEVALMLILASKHGSFKEAEDGVREDLRKFSKEKADDLYEKMYWFDATFQHFMQEAKMMTGRDESEPKFLNVGLRLTRLTPDYAFEYYSKGVEEGKATKGFNDLCKKMEFNFGQERGDALSDLSSSRPNSANLRPNVTPNLEPNVTPNSSLESLNFSHQQKLPSLSPESPLSSVRLIKSLSQIPYQNSFKSL